MVETKGPAGGSFKKRTADLPSGPVTYHIAGDGPPVLYFHSAGGIRFTYALDELAKNFRIHMFVAPGFDGTPAHDGILERGIKAILHVLVDPTRNCNASGLCDLL